MFDGEEGNGVEGVGPLEEEDEFYPESSQWEAEEEVTKPPPPPPPPAAAAPAPAVIAEKVTFTGCQSCRIKKTFSINV